MLRPSPQSLGPKDNWCCVKPIGMYQGYLVI